LAWNTLAAVAVVVMEISVFVGSVVMNSAYPAFAFELPVAVPLTLICSTFVRYRQSQSGPTILIDACVARVCVCILYPPSQSPTTAVQQQPHSLAVPRASPPMPRTLALSLLRHSLPAKRKARPVHREPQTEGHSPPISSAFAALRQGHTYLGRPVLDPGAPARLCAPTDVPDFSPPSPPPPHPPDPKPV
jgi:hypothetical protein